MESVLVKPKEPAPHPQEPEDRRNFRLQNTFSETCFVFLASVLTNLYTRIWAGFPVGAGAGGGERKRREGTVPELCPAST